MLPSVWLGAPATAHLSPQQDARPLHVLFPLLGTPSGVPPFSVFWLKSFEAQLKCRLLRVASEDTEQMPPQSLCSPPKSVLSSLSWT